MRSIILTFPLLSLLPACAADDLDVPGAVPACQGSVCDFGIDDPDDDPWPDPTPPDVPDDAHDTVGGDSGGGDPDDTGFWTYTALGQQLFDDGVITGDVTDAADHVIGTYELTLSISDTEVAYEARLDTPEVFMLVESRMDETGVSHGRVGIDNADGGSKYAEATFTLDQILAADEQWANLSVQESEVLGFSNELFGSLITPTPATPALPADLLGGGTSSCGPACVGGIAIVIGICNLSDLCHCAMPWNTCIDPLPPDHKVACCHWAHGEAGDLYCTAWLRHDGTCK